MTHDFNYVWDMVSDLRATSSTIDKQGIIEDYCNHNSVLRLQVLLRKFFSTLIILFGNIMSQVIISRRKTL